MSVGIGKSIHVKGDVTAREPFLIAGSVEGTIEIDQHTLTIADGASVSAAITAESVVIGGTVQAGPGCDRQDRDSGDRKARRRVLGSDREHRRRRVRSGENRDDATQVRGRLLGLNLLSIACGPDRQSGVASHEITKIPKATKITCPPTAACV